MVILPFVYIAVLTIFTPRIVFAQLSNSTVTYATVSGSGSVLFNSSTAPATISNDVTDSTVDTGCSVEAVDMYLYNTVTNLLKVEKMTLLEYRLTVVNYTTYNPLVTNLTVAYRLNKWSRVTTSDGQTLLGLAFNYGILSIKTLTLATTSLEVDLYDRPAGCFGLQDEAGKTEILYTLLMKDFKPDGQIAFVNEERVCLEIIEGRNGYAYFKDRCYAVDQNTGEVDIDDGYYNIWLVLLYAMLQIVRFTLLFFGPLLFIGAVLSMSKDNIPYVVKLKECLYKTIVIQNRDTQNNEKLKFRRKLDLTEFKGFQKLKEAASVLTPGEPVKVKFTQYDITVNYKRTLTENVVPVGVLENLFETIFKCQIRQVGPFQQCCYKNALEGCVCCRGAMFPWLKFWKKVAYVLLIMVIPLPYYIRLVLFYTCEYTEVMYRKDTIAQRGLQERYENSLIHYFTPFHPFFIVIYVVHFFTAILLAFMSKKNREGRLLKVIVESFRDLATLSWTETLAMIVSNIIWPFKNYGFLGCLVALVYWPVIIPITVVISFVYFLPTVYLTVRMIIYTKEAIFERSRRRKKNKPYQVNVKTDRGMKMFETDALLERYCSCINSKAGWDPDASEQFDDDLELNDIDIIRPELKRDQVSQASSVIKLAKPNCIRWVLCVLNAIVCIATLYAVVIILSEVIGCLVEIIVFTIMGIIVNAGALFKYVMLVLMVFGYSCDCFNNMAKKYLKLNKALFGEVKSRIKDLHDVTSLPSYLQENRGFKSQELNEQAEYESPDDVAEKRKNHWMINDLVLFTDSEDMPRIPKQLFDEVCQIRVAGVPGPVFQGHIEAFEQFLKIATFVGFVFIIVLTFGAVYHISSTNQTLATLFGGLLPLILRTFLSPPAPEIEIGTVSFRSKMDEVIKNFCQYWPIYDLPFELVENEEIAPDALTAADEDEVTTEAHPLMAPKLASNGSRRSTNSGHTDYHLDVPTQQSRRDSAWATQTNVFRMVEGDLPFYIDTGTNNYSHSTDNLQRHSTDVTSAPKKLLTLSDKREVIDEDENVVDILICMPEKYDGVWLDEWSDFASRTSRTSRSSIYKLNNNSPNNQDQIKDV